MEARQAREIDPTAFFGAWSEVNALAFGGDARAALDIAPRLLGQYGRHPWLLMAVTAAYDALGLVDHALAVFQELIARSQTEYVQPSVLAVAAEHARRHDQALAFLRQAVEIRDPVLGAFALHSRPMAKLRGTREFADIIAALGTGATSSGLVNS